VVVWQKSVASFHTQRLQLDIIIGVAMAGNKKRAAVDDDSKMSPELIKQLKQEKADREMLRKSGEAYDKAIWSEGMRNGGYVMTPKSTPYKCRT
jgi:hypothetical protein